MITAVILNHNLKIDELVKELQGQKLITEIIVIENNSKTHKQYDGTEQIVLDKDLSFSAANNIGIDKAKNDYVLLVNNDIWNIMGDLQSFIDLMKKDEAIKVVGCKILNLDGSLNHAGVDFVIIGDKLAGVCHIGSKDKPDKPEYNEIREVKAVTFAFVLLKRIPDVRLDDHYWFNYEDTDYCFTIRVNGGKVYYNPNITIHHLESSEKIPRMLSDIYFKVKVLRGRDYFIEKWNKKMEKLCGEL